MARVIVLSGILGLGAVPLAAAQTTADTTRTTTDHDDDRDYGWIGLLGLAGLAGLLRRERRRDTSYQTAASRT